MSPFLGSTAKIWKTNDAPSRAEPDVPAPEPSLRAPGGANPAKPEPSQGTSEFQGKQDHGSGGVGEEGGSS